MQIHRWWLEHPDAGVAIALGEVSGGLVALDFDDPSQLAALVGKFGIPLPETRRHATRRGFHLLFCSSVPLRTTMLLPGVELRANGSYIVAPPSPHPAGGTYAVECDCDPAPLPNALIARLKGNARAASAPNETGGRIREGERNRSLTSLAGTMRKRGMTPEAILAALLAENTSRCEPPLLEREVKRIVASVGRYRPEPQNPKPDEACRDAGPYCVEGGRIFFEKQTPNGSVLVPLSNFDARIKEEIVLDDGHEQTRAFQVEGTLATGKPLPLVCIPAEKFSPMNWVAERWGARTVVSAGQGTRDRLREAIQCLSGDVPVRRVFGHTGWVRLDGKSVFLSASGAIGQEAIEVDLPSELRRYALPCEADNPREAMAISLRLLDAAPLTVTAPLWAAVFRAPLAAFYPIDVSIFLHGPTGVLKSTLAALFLSHFGHFERTSLPGAWSSTANALEHRAFTLKDVPFVVDDFAPSPLDLREMESKAARLLRAQGNLAGRGRLRSDMSERPSYPPRGLIISTGEQIPTGQSILARMLVVEVEPEIADVAALSDLQSLAHRLTHAMAAYITWLAPQTNALPKLLADTFIGTRARAHQQGTHLRVPEALAHLWLGAAAGLQFADEVGALSQEHAEEVRAQCWAAFVKLGEEQSRIIEGERPTRRFLEVLGTLLAQGRAIVLPKGQEPDEKSRADFLGWYDTNSLFLLPDAAFQAVSRFCRESGEPFSVRRVRLLRDMRRESLSEADPGHGTTLLRVGEKRTRVVRLNRKAVEKFVGETIAVTVVTAFPEGGG